MQSYALTDVGRIRSINQDSVFSSPEAIGPLSNLFMVADGMGGHRAGDYASRFLVDHLTASIKDTKEEPVIKVLEEGIRTANSQLYIRSLNDPNLMGMGTTLVAAVIEQNTLYVANIGDSRLYLIGDEIRQITRDHSYVEELVLLGQMERGSEDYLSKKNIITRAVGTDEHVEVDFFEVTLHEHDQILLCSDGLTNMVEESAMREVIRSDESLEVRAKKLIALANENGGRDNIAVILIDPGISEV